MHFIMTKQEIEKKKALARSLFLSGMEQQEIAEHCGVSRVTISKWVNAEGWKEARAAKTITRPELVNKLLLAIDRIIQQVNDSDGGDAALAGLGDKLSKLASVIEKLDKKTSVVNHIETFMKFSEYLRHRAETDPEITPALLKVINRYQDDFIAESMSHGGH